MVKVLIADDHQMMLEGWRTVLANEANFQVVGEARKGEEVINFLKKNKVDLLVTDIDMGSRRDDGLEAIRSIKKTHPTLPILVVSMHDEIGFIDEAMEVGADGYLFKSNSTEEMITAMRELANGKTYYSQEVMRKVAGKMRRLNESEQIRLTKQEKRVLPLLCQGLTSKEIGEEIGISYNTVNTYRKQLHLKFEVSKISELINKSRELGYIK
ncbi:MAG: response regulator transcription factor [Fulvivirga sp.]|uniref:response regulator transcription factor n=1 Tax=Fulvivirga sp. TaxID=1931237 RepID=UPI0032EEAA72